MTPLKSSSNAALLQQLQSLRTPTAGTPAQLNTHISQTVSTLESLSASQLSQGSDKAGQDLLDVLDPALDTLPYLYVLKTQIDQSIGKSRALNDKVRIGGALYQRLTTFLSLFDPVEIRYAGTAWRKLLDVLAAVILEERAADLTAPIILMASAMLRLDPSSGTFTSNHLRFVQICLEKRMYAQACLILDSDIHSLPSSSTAPVEGIFSCSPFPLSDGYVTIRSGLTDKVTLNDVLEYYLSGAMAYIGLKRWSSAMFFLEHVLSVPSNNAANGYMLEAYKKWTLVNLLVNGKPTALPKSASGSSVKTLKALARPYDTIVDAFTRRDSAIKLRTEVDEAQGVLEDDGNYGLALNVVNHHRKLSIRSLDRVFAAVPLASVSLNVPPGQAEDYVNSLIAEGVLNGRLERSAEEGGPVVLRFFQDNTSGPHAKSETELRRELAMQTNRIKELAQHVAGVDERISLTKEYLDHVRKARKNKEDRNTQEDDAMDVSMSAQLSEEEESLMADTG